MSAFFSAFSPVKNLKQLVVRPEGNFPVLDGFRAISMLMIIVFHSAAIYCGTQPTIELIDMVEQSTWAAWVWNSDKSVDIFFVISGFLITGILLRQLDKRGHIQFGNFYWRRFMRLSPAYWVVILLYVALGLPNGENIWANLLYVNNFLPYDAQAMNWTWTLAIEEQFYLIYPVLLLFLVSKTQNPLRWMWVLLGVSLIIRAAVILLDERIRLTPGSVIAMDSEFHSYHFSVLYDNLYTRFGSLLCGCIAAFYYFHHEPALRLFLNSFAGKICEFLSFAIVVIMLWLPILSREFDDSTVFNILYQIFSRALFSAAIAYLALVCLEGSYLSRFLNLIFANRFWYPLAQLSYSMYLLHVFPIAILSQMAVNGMTKNPEVFDYTHWEAITRISAYSAVVTILGALLLYLIIERPLMNLRK